jgi:hypothetical protein
VAAQAGELLPKPAGRQALEAVEMLGLAAELGRFRPESAARIAHDLLHLF